MDRSAEVLEFGTQILVELVELGASDNALLPREAEYLDGLCDKIKSTEAKALILGCTHFSHLTNEISSRLPHISVIDTASLGAEALAEYLQSSPKSIKTHPAQTPLKCSP